MKPETFKKFPFGLPRLALLLGAALAVLPLPSLALTSLDDAALSRVTGQNMFVADVINGSSVGAAGNGYTYYRMGLNGTLDMNMNINKLQLGCGGYNEIIRSGCDVDMDFVSFMGRSATRGGGAVYGTTPGSEGAAPGSDFRMTRPYIEIATTGNNPATREVVGIKIGAQSADGYMSVGRVYSNGQINQETGVACNTATPLSCHSGINMLSGNMHVEMSGTVPVNVLGFTNTTACFGVTARTDDQCGSTTPPVFRDIIGSRIKAIVAESIPLTLNLLGLHNYASLNENLRLIHGFALENTGDFSLSFQRQQLVYPNYNKTGFNGVANAGWWMNVPYVASKNINGSPVNVNSLGELASALSPPGLPMVDIELNSTPVQNCFGSSMFC